MADQNLNSNNIDSYRDFDFRTLSEDDEIEVFEQDYRSFPLSMITQKKGIMNIEVIIEMYKWDYWLRNFSINKFKSAFKNSFNNLHIDGVSEVIFGEVTEEDGDKFILLAWTLRFPTPNSYKDIKRKILTSVDVILHNTRHQLEEKKSISTPKGFKRFFLVDGSSYIIGTGTFWVAGPIICSLAFLLGTVKYDADKITLLEDRKSLQDTIRVRENTIKYLRHNSDSALTILSNMPYKEMKLDTSEFRKVQTNIENAGAALYLNK